MAYYRIICKNHDHTLAYAEKLSEIHLLDHGECYVRSAHGDGYYCQIDELSLNPEIIRECAGGYLYRIKLEVTTDEESDI